MSESTCTYTTSLDITGRIFVLHCLFLLSGLTISPLRLGLSRPRIIRNRSGQTRPETDDEVDL